MTTTLRVVLDQPTPTGDDDARTAARDLAAALVVTAPSGCEVRGIVPSDADQLDQTLALAGVDRLPFPAAPVAELWRRGFRVVAGAGLIHSPTLAAPLMRHDRVHDHDQTVVTMWDSRAWDAPDELPRTAVAWSRAMLRRAARHADAVVVPTHALAHRVAEIAPLGDRIRVIAGAASSGLRVPSDEIGRRRELGLPEGYILVAGSSAASAGLHSAFTAIARNGRDTAVVVLDAPAGDEPAIADIAAAAGIPERRLHVRGALEPVDRAAVYAGSVAFLAAAQGRGFPWRVLDALEVGVPIVATRTEVHREVLLDGAALADPDDDGALAEALSQTLASTAAVERLAVLAADRGRAFGWRSAAERVWQLHAEL
jgi:glycosyltransferase involved in cell wall biosynthesis